MDGNKMCQKPHNSTKGLKPELELGSVWAGFPNQCVCVFFVTQSCLTLSNPMDCSPPGTSVHGHSPSKNTGMGCHALLQGIFPTQGSNPLLPHCRQILYHLSHQGNLMSDSYAFCLLPTSSVTLNLHLNYIFPAHWVNTYYDVWLKLHLFFKAFKKTFHGKN